MIICVYGAASNKINSSYIEAVEELGRRIAKRGHSIVYGAGSGGLMGAVARGVHEGGGEICGVAPTFFDVDGVLFEHCTELVSTETMRERKRIMEERAEAFIMVPGGVGTFDEFFEILTLKQLKRHNKAMAVYNVNHYYDHMADMMDNAIKQGFVTPDTLKLYEVLDDADKILDYIEQYDETKYVIGDVREIRGV